MVRGRGVCGEGGSVRGRGVCGEGGECVVREGCVW